jgi:hypothetical protein
MRRQIRFAVRLYATLVFVLWWSALGRATPAEALFRTGVKAYRAGDYAQAALAFRESAARQPGSGTLQNLGNAEWQRGQTGAAVLAWEQARWLDPFNDAARQDLRFARKAAQLEAPDLAWYEVVSSWLTIDAWTWIAGTSLWLAVGMVLLPGVLRRRKAAWHQAVAALGFMIFLLSVPAHLGGHTRAQLGFVLEKNTPLRLTPTSESQPVTFLSAGESARCERTRGNYLLIRTRSEGFRGWVERRQFGFICSRGPTSRS